MPLETADGRALPPLRALLYGAGAVGGIPLVWSAFNVGGLLLHVFLLGPVAAYFAGRAAWRVHRTT